MILIPVSYFLLVIHTINIKIAKSHHKINNEFNTTLIPGSVSKKELKNSKYSKLRNKIIDPFGRK